MVKRGAPVSRRLPALVREIASQTPHAAAVIAPGRTLDFLDLADEIELSARRLRGIGVSAGTRVGLLCTNRWEWLVVAFGAMQLGARVAAFNTWAMKWDLEYMVRHSGVEVLVTLDRFRGREYTRTALELAPRAADARPGGWTADDLPALREIVVIGDSELPTGFRRFSQLDAGREPAEDAAEPGNDGYVLYTSGSSARPKAVPLEQATVIANGWEIGERMGLEAGDRVLVSTPLFWSYGAVNAVPAVLTHGATLVLQEVFEPGEALELIEHHRCTAIYTLPNITRALIHHEAFSPRRTASLRTGLTIGGPEDVRLAAETLGARQICNIYGSTETYGNCCVTPWSLPYDIRQTCQGPPLPGADVEIVDTGGRPLPSDAVGEIVVRRPLAHGYLMDDGQTVDAITDADGWYHTGDLGHFDDEGRLHFVGRRSEMIKTGGINVSPLEVEEFLCTHDAILEAAVTGATDEAAGEIVVAFVVLRDGAALDLDALTAWGRERVAAYKLPRRLVMVDELPKTDTGKVSRRALKERLAETAPVPEASQ